MAAACCGGMAMSRAIPNCGTWVQNRAAYEELRDLVPSGSCLSLCRQPSSQHGQLVSQSTTIVLTDMSAKSLRKYGHFSGCSNIC